MASGWCCRDTVGVVATNDERAAAAPAPQPAPQANAFEPRIGRIPIRFLSPESPENRWPAKAYAGEVVPFGATVFREGHDALGVELVLTDPTGVQTVRRMRAGDPGTDRWLAEVQVDGVGDWRWHIRAWSDDWGTWLHNAEIKVPLGQDIEVVFALGVQLLKRARRRRIIADAIKTLQNRELPPESRLSAATDSRVAAALEADPIRSLVTTSPQRVLRVERSRAGLGSWYEFFIRSEGAKQRKDGSWQSGTFRTAAKRLPAVAAMGFDVVYTPPIHPIGEINRKGPNNTLTAGEHDPGSPYAIGSKDGGHDAIHPELGTRKDFVYFLRTAQANGLEFVMDLALQCAPDHPWVTEHPEWFTTLPDGSIAYAENPPKKYQDIYPLNFDNDPIGIREEILRVTLYWVALGVKIFRVDNPHTKPLAFWEWFLTEMHDRHPEVVFLAEAFTRPAMMQSLAAVGYQQSYTYFTWRNTKQELEEFFTSISKETSAFMRPNLFVNTPDILTEFLQFGGVPAYKIRAALAATASPSWGVYSGYELIENVARPGAEENIDNEKYEFRPRDWAKAEAEGRSIAPYLTQLNRIRKEHPALHQLRNLDVHWSDDDAILVYTKYLAEDYTRTGEPDGIIVVANVDPHSVRETTVHLDLTKLGLPVGSSYGVTDLITGAQWTWGTDNYVRLDAFHEPVHVLSVRYD